MESPVIMPEAVPWRNGVAMLFLGIAFLAWGLLRSLSDLLVSALQLARPQHDAAAMAVHVSFFAAYLIVPWVAARMLGRWGAAWVIGAACALMAVGALWSTRVLAGGAIRVPVASTWVAAAGIACLQTGGNAMAVCLGPRSSSARRLLLLQALPPLASASAPWMFQLAKGFGAGEASSLVRLYEVGAVLAVVGMLGFVAVRLPLMRSMAAERERDVLWRIWSAVLSAFLFVGIEATVVTHIPQYFRVHRGDSSRLLLAGLSGYWASVVAGRVLFSFVVRRFALRKVLLASAAAGAMLLGAMAAVHGVTGGILLMLTGLVNAAVFPLLLAIASTGGSARQVASVSAWMAFAICGGGLMPVLSGWMADVWGFHAVFVLPALAYVWIAGSGRHLRSVADVS